MHCQLVWEILNVNCTSVHLFGVNVCLVERNSPFEKFAALRQFEHVALLDGLLHKLSLHCLAGDISQYLLHLAKVQE